MPAESDRQAEPVRQRLQRNRIRPNPMSQGDAAVEAARPSPPAEPAERTIINLQPQPEPPQGGQAGVQSGPRPNATGGANGRPGASRAEQQPASPPQVQMQNGQLSITARNSTLSDVLGAVRRATGAEIDGPMASAQERVFVSLGPDDPQQVLAALLRGSRFDYIILGSAARNGGLKKILLTARGAPAPAGQRGYTTADPIYEEPEPEYEEVQPLPEIAPEGKPTDPGQMQPGQTPVQPGQDPSQPTQQQPDDPNRIKTPEELLQELQRLQQQQQEQNLPPDQRPQRPPR